ncbi:MAG: flippase-like domain-containing protein, partial [Deltaproteobacteria bacterium]|nr:flippase-like domain-containing protein [Deltaproteobacteria bacterium]
MSRRLKMLILKVVVSMALIFYLFGIQRIDIAQVGRTLEKADILWMAAALLTLLLGRVITALRWQVLLTAQDIRVSMKTLLFSLFVA